MITVIINRRKTPTQFCFLCLFTSDYPESINNLLEDYPVAPESLSISESMLSNKQKLLLTNEDGIFKFTISPQKLMQSLHNKVKYILHFRNLKQDLSYGMVFKKVYFVCLFVFLFISFCVGDFMYVRVCVHIHVLVCVKKSIFLQK